MRKYKRTGGYRSGQVKKSKKTLIIRGAFIVFCALLLTLLSVLLGKHLQRKADYAAGMTSGTDSITVQTENISDLFPEGIKIENSDARELEICAADIDITAESAEDLVNKVNSLPDGYNAISVRINSADGKLVYVSPALMEYAGMNSELVSRTASQDTAEDTEGGGTSYDVFENLKSTIAAAKHSSLRSGIYFRTDASVLEQTISSASRCEIDAVIISELATLGADEILIEGLVVDEGLISNDTLRGVIRYVALLREKCGDIHIGINLPDSVYLVPQNASVIKTLSEYLDFLAISIETELTDADAAYSAVYDNCYSLKGNFSVYNLRGVIKSDIPEIASAVNASLRALSAKSTQFTAYVEDPSYTPPSVSVPETAETGVSNDNANRSEDYEATQAADE